MTQAYIHEVKEKALALHEELIRYQLACRNDAERDGTGKLYPENIYDHGLLGQTLCSLEHRIQTVVKEVNGLIMGK